MAAPVNCDPCAILLLAQPETGLPGSSVQSKSLDDLSLGAEVIMAVGARGQATHAVSTA